MRLATLYIICFPNGNLYVGITTNTAEGRFRRHIGSRFPVGHAIRKYGAENCRLVVLRRNVLWPQACALERFYIRELRTRLKQGGYNLTAGGEGKPDRPASAKCRAAVGNAVRKKWSKDPEYQAKMLDILRQGRTVQLSDPLRREQAHAKAAATRRGKKYRKVGESH